MCSGVSVGLPGGRQVFDPNNFCDILSGQNRIEHIGEKVNDFLNLNLVRLMKDPRDGSGVIFARRYGGQSHPASRRKIRL